MNAVPLTDNIYWVGAIDWDLRNFHGYLTQRGSTYNAYLIIDEKITLIDTVKAPFFDEMLSRISSVIDPARITTHISNHVEMDHSGSLPRIAALNPEATIYTSPKGAEGLKAHYGQALPLSVVKTGDSLSLGSHSLSFIQTPMVHWPDNMLTYCPEAKVLFSNDAFGQHLATAQRFDDECPLDIVVEEAAKYYANIVLPYSSQVAKALSKADGLAIECIAPSHGLVWRSYIATIMKHYSRWAANESMEKALIIYDTMWNSTGLLAKTLQDVFEAEEIPCERINLHLNHISDIMTDVLDARYICVGSPTLNSTILPTVGAFLTYLEGLAPKNRTGLAFGSYGWGGQSVPKIHDWLSAIGFSMCDPLKVRYIPTGEELSRCAETFRAQLATIRNVQ